MLLLSVRGFDSTFSVETESLVTQSLLEQEIPVVDQTVVDANIQKIKSVLSASGDDQGAVMLGTQFGADVIVRGEAVVRSLASHIANSKLQSFQAQIKLQAISTDNGQLLASAADAATVLALDAETGGPRALQSATSKMLGTFIPALLSSWEQQVSEGHIRPASDGGAVSLARALQSDSSTDEASLPSLPADYTPPVAAIWQLTPQNGVPSDWMALITDKLHAMIVKSGWFRLVTRDDMEKLLAEHNVQMSDACDSTAQAVEYGKILSANQIIIGAVGRLGQTYQVVLKQVNVESGEIEHVGQAEGRGGAEVLLRLVKMAAADLLRNETAAAPTTDPAVMQALEKESSSQ
ncbi:MAG: hypothetical protein A2X46_11160 [Lentisphaerae bacterium GWF2_57_35]|nr:MAG: hypothetical protein A2X46_11160 [Lentisphaerae bacterium GWF2_57_35]